MKVGVVVYSNDSETVWSAFRFANFAVAMGDEVRVFLIGKGVDLVKLRSFDTDKFNVTQQLQEFFAGGKVFVCGTCLGIHGLEAPRPFVVSTLKDIYEIVKTSDRVVTF